MYSLSQFQGRKRDRAQNIHLNGVTDAMQETGPVILMVKEQVDFMYPSTWVAVYFIYTEDLKSKVCLGYISIQNVMTWNK